MVDSIKWLAKNHRMAKLMSLCFFLIRIAIANTKTISAIEGNVVHGFKRLLEIVISSWYMPKASIRGRKIRDR